jgi:cobalamin biosynthesis protein CobD/CbiB
MTKSLCEREYAPSSTLGRMIPTLISTLRKHRHVCRAEGLLLVILLIVQIWLLSATLETYLAGHAGAVLPGAIFSALLFSAALTLNSFVSRVDKSSRRP